VAAVRLIHIAPELPPTVGGVADYAAILSRRLVEVSDGEVEPVLIHAGHQAADTIEVDFPVVDLSGQCSATALANTVARLAEAAAGRAVVLLEYSGYGYATRGAPLWVARGLRRVCGDGLPLVTMFHEISASGPIWTSAFWLAPLQKWVAGSLARHSTAVLANRRDSTRWLRERTENAHFQPVFSNVGELETLPDWENRSPYAIVFGGTGKETLYTQHTSQLQRLLRAAGVQTLVDIGPPPQETLRRPWGKANVDVQGFVERRDVSGWLQEAQLALLCRNPQAFTKSGSLMAYLAHGVPAVIATRHSTRPNPDLKERTHYLTLPGAVQKAEEEGGGWSAIGRNGYDWYRENAHSREGATTLLRLIGSG